jgi:hypothetical protein
MRQRSAIDPVPSPVQAAFPPRWSAHARSRIIGISDGNSEKPPTLTDTVSEEGFRDEFRMMFARSSPNASRTICGSTVGRSWTRQSAARIWRGRTRREVADEYEAYNYEVGIRPLIEKAMGVQTLRETEQRDRVHHDLLLGEH